MAVTKKHLDLRAQKVAIRAEIADLHKACVEATKTIPTAVINGSQQVASAWRDAAENLMHGVIAFGGERATVDDLNKIKNERAALLRLLEAKQDAPIVSASAEAPTLELVG